VKKLWCLVLATAALLFLTALPADAQKGFTFRSRVDGGFRGHTHSHSHSKVFLGFGVGLGPAWGWGWPSYYYPYPAYAYPYPAYAAPVVVQPSPPVYTQQGAPAEPYYWYYCESAQAYYPYVQQCPSGWMKVVPTPEGAKPE
jgi:hypothetical protein